MLHLKGCIVTMNAIGCQKTIVQQLHEYGAAYVRPLKGNQWHMNQVVRKHSETLSLSAEQNNTYPERSSGHGRAALRSY